MLLRALLAPQIYSLGIALFATLMRGHKPLGNVENVPDIIPQVLGGGVLATARFRLAHVHAETRDFVLSMLALEPDARPSAAALLASAFFDGIREEAERLFNLSLSGMITI